MRRQGEPLEKVTINLYKGDFAKLQDLLPRIGASYMIRKLVREYLNQRLPAVNIEELLIEDELRQ